LPKLLENPLQNLDWIYFPLASRSFSPSNKDHVKVEKRMTRRERKQRMN